MSQDDGATGPATSGQILAAVREAIAAEVERVDHPGPRPWDSAGWHAYNPRPVPSDVQSEVQQEASGRSGPSGPSDAAGTGIGIGHPVYDPEAWRWFQLVDLAYLPALVLLEFTWGDPRTPDLHYVTALDVPTTSADFAASVVRSTLRAQLAPGWRQRVQRTWLALDRVLVGPPARSPRIQQSMERLHDEVWEQPRPLG